MNKFCNVDFFFYVKMLARLPCFAGISYNIMIIIIN